MQAIFLVTFPFFALVLAGYIAVRRNMLPDSAIPGLNGFVLFFALPCMLYKFGASTPFAQLLNLPLMAVYALCAVIIVAFAIMVTRNQRIGLRDASFGALVAAFPNTGFMGVPLLVALLGPSAAGPTIVTILVDLFLTSSLCIAVAQMQGASHHGGAAALRAIRGALSNPLPWSIGAGALASFWHIRLPQPVDSVVAMLASAASPVALFTIGAVLGSAAKKAAQDASHVNPLIDTMPPALIKLVIHPALVLLVGLNAMRLGWPVSREAVTVVTLVAALPSASNVSLLASRYDADVTRIARIILQSTALAFLTFSAAAYLLRPDG
jgi:malonate transporter and related proteins